MADTELISVHTGRNPAVVDLTDQAVAFVAGRGDGLLSVFVPHATAGVALIETGSGTETDLLEVVAGLLPRDERWVHRHGSAGHGGDHVFPAFVSPAVAIPVVGGRPALGTWQSIVLVDPNPDNADRTVRFSFLSG